MYTYIGKYLQATLIVITLNSCFLFLGLFSNAMADVHGKTSTAGLNYRTLIIIFFLFVVIAALLSKKRKRRERKFFTAEVKRGILKKQKHNCAYCKRNPGVLDFDHKDGNRCNNKMSNCIALCPNCHAKKTRGLVIFRKKCGTPIILVIFLFIFLLFVIIQ